MDCELRRNDADDLIRDHANLDFDTIELQRVLSAVDEPSKPHTLKALKHNNATAVGVYRDRDESAQ
jgi:hypothetical protein